MWDSSSWDDQWEDLPATERPWTRVLYYLMFTLKQREERTSMQSISFYSGGKGISPQPAAAGTFAPRVGLGE